MIVEFSVKNFRSINELQTISFVATGLKSSDKLSEIDKNNIVKTKNTKLLKTIGVYGSNASGKSNVIKALDFFLQVIRNEASSESNLGSLCDPFLYQEKSFYSESFFQIIFLLDEKKYRYGFTVKNNPKKSESTEKVSSQIIINEWLFGTKGKNMVELFKRTGLDVQKDKFPNGDNIPFLPYVHSLFLTHSAAFDKDSISASIRQYFNGWTLSNLINGEESFRQNTLLLLEKENKKKDFLNLLSSFNLNYDDIILERDNPMFIGDKLSQNKIFMIKSYKDSQKESLKIKLNLSYNESSGTQKLFDLAGLLFRAFNGRITAFIIIDEIDSNFHPSLLIKLISLFNDPSVNKSNSQLLFTSHDTNLMSPSIMRRDQFYFTEKQEDESTRLYSLADLRGIRNDADFAKHYLAGFYGAIPVLENYSNENSL